MAALINGVTIHSYHGIQHRTKDGTAVTARKDNKKDMSKDFVRYQSLRFMFIDEFSTASLEILAEVNYKTRTYIRKDGTWSTRNDATGEHFSSTCDTGDSFVIIKSPTPLPPAHPSPLHAFDVFFFPDGFRIPD